MSTVDPAIVTMCERMIAIPSVTGEGTQAIVEFCARELLAPHGIEARSIVSSKECSTQVNLVAFVAGRNRAATPLVLNTHPIRYRLAIRHYG
jgi:hypothetical protein